MSKKRRLQYSNIILTRFITEPYWHTYILTGQNVGTQSQNMKKVNLYIIMYI